MAQHKVLLPGENSGPSSAVGKSKEPAIASVKRGRGRPPKIQGLQATRKTRVAYVSKSLMRRMKPFFVPEGARSLFIAIVPVLANKRSRNLVQKMRNSFTATVVLRHRKMSRLNL